MSRRSAALEAPCERLARECSDAGQVFYAARIRELLPADVSADDHRELLASVLAELAADVMVPDPIRDAARHLADVAVEPAPFIGRCGTVFVAWAGFHRIRPGQPPPTYTDYWDQYPDGDYAFLEQGPDTADLSEVLHWARARSDRIIVRPEFDPLNAYWGRDTRTTPTAATVPASRRSITSANGGGSSRPRFAARCDAVQDTMSRFLAARLTDANALFCRVDGRITS